MAVLESYHGGLRSWFQAIQATWQDADCVTESLGNGRMARHGDAATAGKPRFRGSRMMPAWLVYTLLTAVLWGVWGFESKLLVNRTSPYTGQVLFTLGLLLPAGAVLFSPRRFAGKQRGRGLFFAVVTGLLGGIGNIAFFMALAKGNASVIVPLTSLSPLVTVLVGVLVLKEKVRRFQYAGLGLALAAIYLLSL
ncbi:MAG: EamA family transporter [Bryobacteraceae bacterium]